MARHYHTFALQTYLIVALQVFVTSLRVAYSPRYDLLTAEQKVTGVCV